MYWHSDFYKEQDYHLNKTKKCQDLGIRLIHIWEDQWINKKEIIKSRISNLLGCSRRIYARNCNIQEIDNNTYKEFMDCNHLQGYAVSKYRIGLYNNGILVSVMSFGSLRKSLGSKNTDNIYELIRFCNLLNLSVETVVVS